MAQRKVNCEVYTDRGIVGKEGAEGKSAYEQAVEGGYQGTEEEFEQALASDITTVASNISDVNAVGQSISDVNSVAGSLTDVSTVATNVSDVNTVAGISSDVTEVASISAAVSTVSGHDSEVTLVADNMASVMTTASSITDVQNVASDITNINTVAGISSDVSTVATNSTAVNTAATNIAAIIAAPTAATNAANSAAEAQIWAEGTDGQVSPLGGEHSAKGWAEYAEELVETIGQVMHYKGSVATYADLTAIVNPELGDVYNVLADDSNYAWTGTAWDMIGSSVDLSAYRTAAAQDVIDGNISTAITNHTGNTSNPHSVTKAQVGLGNADNTADLDKPISTATQTALNAKQDALVSGTNIKTVNGNSLLGSGNVNINALPSQTGQSGRFLTTDGSSASWADIPTEVDNKSVTLNSNDEIQTVGIIDQNDPTKAIKKWTGTRAAYDAIAIKDPTTLYVITDESGGDYILDVDQTVVEGSIKPVSGGAVYEALQSSVAPAWGNITGTISDQTDLQDALDAKQDELTTAQQNAANSGVTAAKVTGYDTHVANNDIHVTAAQKATWSSKADDSTVVHKTGAETIAGQKIFTNPLKLQVSLTNPIDIIDVTDTDANGNMTLSADYASSGMYTYLNSHNYASNYDATLYLFNNDMGSFSLSLSGSGNATNLSLSQADSSNSSTIIPTKGWVNQYKQDKLTSGTNIKTVNGESLLGSGDLTVGAVPLFFSTWSDHLFEDTSWLRADTFSWQSGSIYTSAYQHLVDDIDGITAATETISGTTITFYRATDGHKICLSDQESNVTAIYNATGVAWYYILDTTNERFKLPRTTFGFNGLRDTVGNYVAPTLPNITGSIDLDKGEIDAAAGCFVRGVLSNFYAANGTGSQIRNVIFDAARSSSIYQAGATVQQAATQMYLYFYVGNTVQDQTTIDVGEITEALNGKADANLTNVPASKGILEERYVNGTSWYRVYSDGWCEQGGETVAITGGGDATTMFLKQFANTNYTITAIGVGAYTPQGEANFIISSKTTSSFTLYSGYNGSKPFSWRACGYIR